MYYRNVLTKIKKDGVYVYLDKEYRFNNKYDINWLEDTLSQIDDETFISALRDKKMIKDKGVSCRVIYNDFIQKIHVQLNTTCMCKCDHCYVGEQESVSISYEDMKTIINHAIDSGVTSIDYSGGEPTLNNSFESIISYGKEQGLRQMLFTNGFVNESLYPAIEKNIDTIQVSIDGPEEYHNAFRRNDKVYQKALSFLNHFSKTTIELIVSMSLTKANVNYIPFVYKVAKQYNASFRLSPPVPAGRFTGVDNAYYTELINEARNVCQKENIMVPELIPSKPMCNAIIKTVYVDAKLNVFPCPLLSGEPFMLGNLKNEDFDMIISTSKATSIVKHIDSLKKKYTETVFFCPAYFFNMECDDNFFGNQLI